MGEKDRKKIAIMLGISENEIFMCPMCKRRFYIDTTVDHDHAAWRRGKEEEWFRRASHCGQCHGEHYFWKGETYLDE